MFSLLNNTRKILFNPCQQARSYLRLYKFQPQQPHAWFATTATGTGANPSNQSDNLEKLTYYQLLEVRQDATSREIKANFLRLAKTYHPDVYKGADQQRFKFIKIAYQVLKKPQTRRQYDAELEEKEHSNSGDKSSGKSSTSSQFSHEEEGDGAASYTMDGKKSDNKRGFSFDGMKLDPKTVDLDKEYEKFFSKPIERQPEEVVAYEDVVERQMSMEDRVRNEYAFIKNNEDEMRFRFGHQDKYQDVLKENIKIMNEKASTTDAVVDFIMKKREIKLKKNEKIILVLLIILGIPFAQHILERRAEINKRIDKGSQLFLKVQEDQELDEFHDRLQYDFKETTQSGEKNESDAPNKAVSQ